MSNTVRHDICCSDFLGAKVLPAGFKVGLEFGGRVGRTDVRGGALGQAADKNDGPNVEATMDD